MSQAQLLAASVTKERVCTNTNERSNKIMSNQDNTVASGNYEYSISDAADSKLQIFSTATMGSTFYTAQETLDLLHFLEAHQAEIEAKAKQQAQTAQQPKQSKSIEQRINDLFS